MARRRLVQTSLVPYHVTSRSNNKEWFYLPIERCWSIFCAKLVEYSIQHQAHYFSFVLMSNHFHLMILTPLANLGDFMRDFLTAVSKAIQFETGRINHVFGGRYKWSLLDSAYSVACVQKYILRNPVRAGICDKVEEYKYSSLQLGQTNPPIVGGIDPSWRLTPRNHHELVNWLNIPTPRELEETIRMGLRREVFAFSKDNSQQAKIRRLREVYALPPDDGVRYLSSLKVD